MLDAIGWLALFVVFAPLITMLWGLAYVVIRDIWTGNL
jgi:hypothetical protein